MGCSQKRIGSTVTFHTAMKSGLKGYKSWILRLFHTVTFHTAMKSGLKDYLTERKEKEQLSNIPYRDEKRKKEMQKWKGMIYKHRKPSPGTMTLK